MSLPPRLARVLRPCVYVCERSRERDRKLSLRSKLNYNTKNLHIILRKCCMKCLFAVFLAGETADAERIAVRQMATFAPQTRAARLFFPVCLHTTGPCRARSPPSCLLLSSLIDNVTECWCPGGGKKLLLPLMKHGSVISVCPAPVCVCLTSPLSTSVVVGVLCFFPPENEWKWALKQTVDGSKKEIHGHRITPSGI